MDVVREWAPVILTAISILFGYAAFSSRVQKDASERGSFEERVRLTCEYLKETADKLQLAIDKNDLRYTDDIKNLSGKVTALSDRMLVTENKITDLAKDLDEIKAIVQRKKAG